MERNVSVRQGARNSALAILLVAVLAALFAAMAPNAAYAHDFGNGVTGQTVLPVAADWEDDEDSPDVWDDEDCDDGQYDEEWDDDWSDDPDGDSDDGDWWLDDDSEWDQDVVWLYDDESDDSWIDGDWRLNDEGNWECDWCEGEGLLAGGWFGDWKICDAGRMGASPGCIAICEYQDICLETDVLTGVLPETSAVDGTPGSLASASLQAIAASRDNAGSSVQGTGLLAEKVPSPGAMADAPGLVDVQDAENRACQLGELLAPSNGTYRAAASSIGGRAARVIQPVLAGFAVKPE